MRVKGLVLHAGICLLILGPALHAASAEETQSTRRDTRIQQDFQRRVARYVRLQERVEASLPPLKQTNSPAMLAQREHLLAARIRAARSGAKPGAIFTSEIRSEFRHIIRTSMRGPNGARIRASFRQSEGSPPHVSIDEPYPESATLESIPPTLLLKLPKLPPELDYHLVGRELILRDVKCDLVIDVIPAAIP